MPICYWSYAMSTTPYMLNQLPTKVLFGLALKGFLVKYFTTT